MNSASQSIEAMLSRPIEAPDSWRGRGARIAFYSHDTLGLGHLRRTQKICAALMRRAPDLSALVISGSAHFRMSDFPPNVDVVKIPSVVKRDAGLYESRYMPEEFSLVLGLRAEIIAASLKEYAPDVILVDHSPTGMKNELTKSFSEVNKDVTWILGLRDIVDSAENVRESWTRDGVFEALEEVYGRIIVYGQRNVFAACDEYQFSPAVREKTSYCGYVTQPLGEESKDTPTESEKPRVVVTIGGGDYYVEEVIGSFIEGLRDHVDEIEFETDVFPGAYLTDKRRDELRARSQGLPLTVREFTNDISAALARSELIVGAGGYNTVTEALAFGKRALLIPRVTMREEQLLRTQALARHGWVEWIHPDQLTSDKLFSAVAGALAQKESPIAVAREDGLLELDGAANAARMIVAELFAAVKKREALQ